MLPQVLSVLLVAVLAFVSGASGLLLPLAAFHLFVAGAILPLIFAAMLHFVPVLTRSGAPHPLLRKLPWLAQGAGVAVALVLEGLAPRWLLHPLATLLAALALILLLWVRRRACQCLGPAHPGWRWYGASLTCLLLALLAVPPLVSIPGAYWSLRGLHLHLNTLGFVGLAALGTLPVLLPTALGLPDPESGAWLKKRLLPVLGAVLLIAVGAALAPLSGFKLTAIALAAAGGVILFLAGLSLLLQWRARFSLAVLWRDGAAASLSLALTGFLLLNLAGLAHGLGSLLPRPAILAYGPGFLLPLVTGALSQLLPVWRWPGAGSAERSLWRARLTAGGQWRALVFLAGGGCVLGEFNGPALVLTGLGMGHFLLGLMQAWRGTVSGRGRAG